MFNPTFTGTKLLQWFSKSNINRLTLHTYLIFFNFLYDFVFASINEPMTVSQEVNHLRQLTSRVAFRVIDLEH